MSLSTVEPFTESRRAEGAFGPVWISPAVLQGSELGHAIVDLESGKSDGDHRVRSEFFCKGPTIRQGLVTRLLEKLPVL